MDEYWNYVAALADGEKTGVCLNRGPDHAAVIIEHLFRVAVKKVEVLTGSLDERVYGTDPVIQAVDDFLQRNSRAAIYILAEEPIDCEKHALFKRVRESGTVSQVEVYYVPSEIKSQYQFHFALADARHYRLEESRRSFEASVQFHNEILGREMEKVFADLKSISNPHILVSTNQRPPRATVLS